MSEILKGFVHLIRTDTSAIYYNWKVYKNKN